ncbi:Holliday junction resolvase Hjc, partial [Acidianus sp. RZ1]|uniref:Holliday junction resolvase Hjc n=1 Tax=Acidianus sp. RZ1 TaxID=1540082 RepID=UPI001491BC8D|nr:endonuclease [Acidianus sp. RZ1]
MNRKKRGSVVERQIVSLLRDRGFAVLRAPASGSKRKDSIPDIVAMKSGYILIIEVKSRKGGKVYISRDQAEGILDFTRKSGGELFIAVKMPRVLRFVPFTKLRKTESGNYVIDEDILS